MRDIPKNSLRHETEAETKRGRYISSVFPVEGYGTRRWIVGCYVDLSERVPREDQQTVAEEIVAQLNKPPERKKFERKRTTPLYGNLEVFSCKFKRDSDGKPYVEMLLVTDDRSNEHFWGEGVEYVQARTRRRKGVS